MYNGPKKSFGRLAWSRVHGAWEFNSLHFALCSLLRALYFADNCSAIGPSAQAGMNVNAPTITITPIRSATNKGV